MKIKQKIRCPKCFHIGAFIFEAARNTESVCPECGESVELTIFYPENSSKGFWVPLIGTTEELLAVSRHNEDAESSDPDSPFLYYAVKRSAFSL